MQGPRTNSPNPETRSDKVDVGLGLRAKDLRGQEY